MKKLVMIAVLSGMVFGCFGCPTGNPGELSPGSYTETENFIKFKDAIAKNDTKSIKQSLINISDGFGAIWIFTVVPLLKERGEEGTKNFIFSEIKNWYKNIQKFTKFAETEDHISYELYVSAIITKLIDRYGNSPWFISNLETFVTRTKNIVAQTTALEQGPSND